MFYLLISVGQECREDLTGWSWLRVSHEVAFELSPSPAIIWGWWICFQGLSWGGIVSGTQFLLPIGWRPYHVGLCRKFLIVLTAWQLPSSRAGSLRGSPRLKRQSLWSNLRCDIPSPLPVCQSHRSILGQCEGTEWSSQYQEVGSRGAILQAPYKYFILFRELLIHHLIFFLKKFFSVDLSHFPNKLKASQGKRMSHFQITCSLTPPILPTLVNKTKQKQLKWTKLL